MTRTKTIFITCNLFNILFQWSLWFLLPMSVGWPIVMSLAGLFAYWIVYKCGLL